MSNLLSVQQIAEKIGVEARTVRIWIRDGKLTAIKLPNGDWRMKEENLSNWLDKRTVKARTQF